MSKFHPFYIIGTLGMMITSILHMFLALALSIPSHSTFFALYFLFFTFLIMGISLTVKEQKRGKETQ